MKKRILKAAVCAAVTMAFAVPAFANALTDVPANHWAYDAVNKLVAAGVVDGYGDGTFRGDKTMTRYEMAQIVAKAMNKVSTVDEKIIVDKLAAEFGQELSDLGVKVDGIQKQLDDQIKFAGDATVQYSDMDEATAYRLRLGATGKINENTKINARLTTGFAGEVNDIRTGEVDRLNVQTNIHGIDFVLGKQDLKLGQGLLLDTNELTNDPAHEGGVGSYVSGARMTAGNLTVVNDDTQDFSAVQYKAHLLGRDITADYLNMKNGDEYAALSTDFNLGRNKVDVEYAQNLQTNANAYKVGTDILGAQVSYIDFEAGALPATSGFYFGDKDVDDKGFAVAYNKEIAKNTNFGIDYKNLDVAGDETKVSLNVKF